MYDLTKISRIMESKISFFCLSKTSRMRIMKKDMLSDNGLKGDLEASEQELKSMAYTAVSFLSFLLLVGGGIFYWLS